MQNIAPDIACWKGRIRTLLLLAASIAVLPTATTLPLSAQVACAVDRPCISRLYISTTNALVARVNGTGWDVINVRWSRPGREGAQTEHPGGNATIKVLTGTTPGVMYTVSVQGCTKRPLRPSRCSPWDESPNKGILRNSARLWAMDCFSSVASLSPTPRHEPVTISVKVIVPWVGDCRTLTLSFAPGAEAGRLGCCWRQAPRGTPEKRPMRDTSKPANGIRQDKVVITHDRSLRQRKTSQGSGNDRLF